MHEGVCDFRVLRALRKRNSLSIAALAAKSRVSASVISKLERNCCTAEMETLYRIAKAFDLTLTDLIALAEKTTSQKVTADHDSSGEFRFDRISFGNVRCMHSCVKKGEKVSRPEIHHDDYEVCWVLRGRIVLSLPEERSVLTDGMAVQFDALLPHTYEAEEDSEIFIVHSGKGKRF